MQTTFTIQVLHYGRDQRYEDHHDVVATSKAQAEQKAQYLSGCVGVKSVRVVKNAAARALDREMFAHLHKQPEPVIPATVPTFVEPPQGTPLDPSLYQNAERIYFQCNHCDSREFYVGPSELEQADGWIACEYCEYPCQFTRTNQ